MITVAFLHTADVHVATVRGLLSEVAPGAVDVHLVDTELLSDARGDGVDAGVEARVLARLRELTVHEPDAIVCTCSTLSGSAERLAQLIETPVVRIDRPMAESTVANGGRVALVVAVASGTLTVSPGTSTASLMTSTSSCSRRQAWPPPPTWSQICRSLS